MRKLFFLFSMAILPMLMLTTSCGDDAVEPDELRSRFTPAQDAGDPFTWTFTNSSLNAVSYAWNFGDGNTSTAESPTHTYTAEGMFTVTLVVTGADGSTNTSTQTIDVVDPDVELKKLTGDVSKTWKLIRDISNMDYPAQVGPNDRSQVWWAYGLNEPIGTRTCFMEEEYIFSLNGDYEYRPMNDMVFAEAGVWDADVSGDCVDATVASNMLNVDGADISAWGAGMHSFEFDIQGGELTLTGSGAHVGLAKVGSDAEYTTPQLSVLYKVISLETDGPVDQLILETELVDAGGYWRFVLVSYDDPNDEPELPGTPPTAGFSYDANGPVVTFTNTSSNADSYSWDFGDGGSSTDENPVHTYAGDGSYEVVMTATNSNGSTDAMQTVVISSSVFTASALHGDGSKTWQLNPAASALSVGNCEGCNNFWSNSADDVTGRACTFDDTYTFDNAGNFDYVTNGDVWAEAGYMGVGSDGCYATGDLTGTYAAWGDGNHAFSVADGDPATITVTGTGAFIALPKAYNGGEYGGEDPGDSVTYRVFSYVNNGTSELLQISVEVGGGAWWTFTMISE